MLAGQWSGNENGLVLFWLYTDERGAPGELSPAMCAAACSAHSSTCNKRCNISAIVLVLKQGHCSWQKL